jgi:rare lipoprotein A
MRVWFRVGVLSLTALAMGCETPGPFVDTDGGPSQPVDLSAVPDAVPRAEPRSEAGNHSPYVVLGRTYRVLPTALGYQAVGVASWYGRKFHGRATSSGQRYDMYAMTAAHRTLPIPSYVEVKNLDNGRRVVVKVNDRGPFRDGRLIDVSYAAAVRLGFVHEGVARVKVEAINPASATRRARRQGSEMQPAKAVKVGASEMIESGERLFLQAGAFSTAEAASAFSDLLRDVVGDRVRIVRFPAQDALHRVRVGPVDDLEEAARLQSLIITADLGVPLIIHD